MPVTIPDEILAATHITEPELKQELALALFQQERLTLGQASALAGLGQLAFQGADGGRQDSHSLRGSGISGGYSNPAPIGRGVIVVSDTSPVLNLARIGRLNLLALLYHEVLIPSAVYEELMRSLSDLPPAIDLAAESRLAVGVANDRKREQELRKYLDPGEAEAIVLALEVRADLLLVDERRGRRTASAAGLIGTGLLGVVASAKRAGLINFAKPVLDDSIQSARFWIGAELYAEVLSELGES